MPVFAALIASIWTSVLTIFKLWMATRLAVGVATAALFAAAYYGVMQIVSTTAATLVSAIQLSPNAAYAVGMAFPPISYVCISSMLAISTIIGAYRYKQYILRVVTSGGG
jgi:hypothetical protein